MTDFEKACLARDRIVGQMLKTPDYRPGTEGHRALARYLALEEPSPILLPVRLLKAQEAVRGMLEEE